MDIRAPADVSWRPGVLARLRTYAEALWRPFAERLAGRPLNPPPARARHAGRQHARPH